MRVDGCGARKTGAKEYRKLKHARWVSAAPEAAADLIAAVYVAGDMSLLSIADRFGLYLIIERAGHIPNDFSSLKKSHPPKNNPGRINSLFQSAAPRQPPTL